MRNWFVLLLLTFLLTNADAAFAQSRSVWVERRDGEITILANGDVRVVETWQVKFSGAPGFTKAFRALPLGAVREFTDWGVSENGQAYQDNAAGSPHTFSVSDDANGKRITWYFPETTNDSRTFVLSYTARGILRAAPAGEQLNWTFIEADRGYSINASRVVLHLPKTFAPNEIKTSANGKALDGQTVEYAGGPFAANAAWTLTVEYPLTTPNIPTLTPPTPMPLPTKVSLARRDADITILPNGGAQFVETWEIQIQGGPINRASRSFALARVDDITEFQVSEGTVRYVQSILGAPQSFDVQRASAGGLIWLKWYFEPTTNATRTITLRYTATGAIHQSARGDALDWTFVEADRDYTIANARVTLHLSDDFNASEISATASSGSARVLDGKTIEFTGGPIAPNQAWSVQARFPHDAINASLPKWQVIEEQQPIYNLVSLFIALLILLGGALGLYLSWFQRGREPARGILAEYLTTPPEDLPPGIAGALLDARVDERDLAATIVDLARRGFMRISQTAHATDYRRQGADVQGLRAYERVLLNEMFTHGDTANSRTLRYSFGKRRAAIDAALYDELVKAGWFVANPARVRGKFALVGCGATVLVGVFGLIAYLIVFEYAPLAICVWLALLAAALVPVVLSRAMPKRTAQGATLAAKLRAFKRYLENLRQYTRVETAQGQFEKYLPYAIAFGLEKTWIKTFAEADTPAPEWYEHYEDTATPTSDPTEETSRPGSISDWSGAARRPSLTGQPEAPAPAMPARASQEPERAPSLDDASRAAFGGLNALSAGFFSMLDTTAQAVSGQAPERAQGSSGGGSSSFDYDSGSSGSSSSSSSDSSSSSSSSSRNSGGGGSSGFG